MNRKLVETSQYVYYNVANSIAFVNSIVHSLGEIPQEILRLKVGNERFSSKQLSKFNVLILWTVWSLYLISLECGKADSQIWSLPLVNQLKLKFIVFNFFVFLYFLIIFI